MPISKSVCVGFKKLSSILTIPIVPLTKIDCKSHKSLRISLSCTATKPVKFEIVSKPFKLVKASLFLIPIPFPSISCPILKLLKLTREVNLGLSLMSIPIGVLFRFSIPCKD